MLADVDKNLAWTSSLGEAYVNQQQDVMAAVQVMRGRAQAAGNLKSTSQEKVSQQGQNIIIEPAAPDVVYVHNTIVACVWSADRSVAWLVSVVRGSSAGAGLPLASDSE